MRPFGRLDIHYSDGCGERHALTGRAVSVGRGEDNDIRVDHVDIAPRQLRISHEAGIVQLRALAAGKDLQVDGVALRPHSALMLDDVAAISVGAVSMTFYRQSESPTVAMPAVADATEPLSIGLRAEIDRAALWVFPASSADIELTLVNLTDRDVDCALEAEGIPADWLTPARLGFTLPAGETSQLRLRLAPERRADIPPGEYPLTLAISRRDEPERALHLRATVTLGEIAGLRLSLERKPGRGDSAYALLLVNLGNGALPLRFSLWDPEDRLEAAWSQSRLVIMPGAGATVEIRLVPRKRPWFGRVRDLSFAILVETETASQWAIAVPGRVRVKPRVRWRG